MTHAPLRLGIAGLNGYGATYFKTLADRTDAQITAVCDTNAVALVDAACRHGIAHRFTDWQALLASGTTDAVCVATPHFLHQPMVLDALRAGSMCFVKSRSPLPPSTPTSLPPLPARRTAC